MSSKASQRLVLGLLLASALAGGCCHEREAGMPIHLEERLDSAAVEGAEVPADLLQEQVWRFGPGASEWQALPALVPGASPAQVTAAEGLLRVRLTETSLAPDEGDGPSIYGGVYVELGDWDFDSWSEILVEARAEGQVVWIGSGFNVRQTAGAEPGEQWASQSYGDGALVKSDGQVHTYRYGLLGPGGPPTEPVRQLTIELGASGPAAIELLSVTLVPKDAQFADSGFGVRSVSSSAQRDFGPQRRAVYTHAPARLSYPLRVPAAGRFDLGLGSFGGDARMAVEVHSGRRTPEVVLDEVVPPGEAWRQRSVDLSAFAGRDVTLTLVADRPAGGGPAVALWTAPTVSGGRGARAKQPNVIFYVIDGASAGLMSVYGYNRRTTPNLERIAAEGVVFENAHSNATWTMPSTASFMTSLHHSVLGGLDNDANPVPANATTMAEHFHRAGYQTGVFTMNPNAGGLSGLDRGVDVFRDFGKRGAMGDPIEAISSQVLQREFWQWRAAYPGTPYWVHFQTTDVHPPYHPPPPFAGLFVTPDRRKEFGEQMKQVRFPFNHQSASVHEHYQEQLAEHGFESLAFYDTMRGLHDESMAHQDHQLGRLVERLKEAGEWQNTLLIVASDHGHPAASYPRFGRGLLDPQPPAYEGALFGELETHVPMIFVWPGTLEGGRRIQEPVSMIDMLPTVLDLAGLPQPRIAQGQSLAPLLLGRGDWQPRPLVFDEFRVAESGELIGNLERVDGRWGGSLEIRAADQGAPPATGRHPAPAGGRWKAQEFPEVPRLLIYDLWSDPTATDHVAEPDPEVIAEAERRLWQLWREHRALAAHFQAGEDAQLSPEQLESLRALGYIE